MRAADWESSRSTIRFVESDIVNIADAVEELCEDEVERSGSRGSEDVWEKTLGFILETDKNEERFAALGAFVGERVVGEIGEARLLDSFSCCIITILFRSDVPKHFRFCEQIKHRA